MKKKIISIILASAMLLSFASCSSKKVDKRSSDRDSHKKHTEETEESEETVSSDEVNSIASYRDYLGLIEGYEYSIHGIEYYYSDSCALADVTGDRIEDLIIMMQRTNNGWANEVPEILVYSYNSGRGVTSLILTVQARCSLSNLMT